MPIPDISSLFYIIQPPKATRSSRGLDDLLREKISQEDAERRGLTSAEVLTIAQTYVDSWTHRDIPDIELFNATHPLLLFFRSYVFGGMLARKTMHIAAVEFIRIYGLNTNLIDHKNSSSQKGE